MGRLQWVERRHSEDRAYPYVSFGVFSFQLLIPYCLFLPKDETTGSHKSISSTTDSQLKYENDRLKKALAQR